MFLCFVPATGHTPGAAALVESAAVIGLIAFTFTVAGFVIAWQMESTQGFHAIMNLVLLPLWLVSGSLFPIAKAHGWVQWLMRANPVTYAVSALRAPLEGHAGVPAPTISVIVTACFAAVLFAIATASATRKTTRSLRVRPLVAAALFLGLTGCARHDAMPVYGRVPAFVLTSQTGATFDSKTLDGKIWVADFFFTTCMGPCPRMSALMHSVQKQIADLP